jgi:hypothetical protein
MTLLRRFVVPGVSNNPMRLPAIIATIEANPGASLHRRVYGCRWRDVLVIDGQAIPLPRDTIHRLEMALVIREDGGSCQWTREWRGV